MKKLLGKVAIITGATKGMGKEHARAFVREGAKVVMTGTSVDLGSELEAELGSTEAVFIKHNVSDSKGWEDVVGLAEERFGPVNILVNNAGVVGPVIGTVDINESDYRQICAINEDGVFFGMRAVLPSMIKAGGGSIINVSSIAGIASVYGSANIAYVGSKFAVRGMSKFVAVEYGDRNIRVNSLHPGAILTPMVVEALGDENSEVAKTFKREVPLNRFAECREVTQLVIFLASDDSSYITGSEYVIDGGLTAH